MGRACLSWGVRAANASYGGGCIASARGTSARLRGAHPFVAISPPRGVQARRRLPPSPVPHRVSCDADDLTRLRAPDPCALLPLPLTTAAAAIDRARSAAIKHLVPAPLLPPTRKIRAGGRVRVDMCWTEWARVRRDASVLASSGDTSVMQRTSPPRRSRSRELDAHIRSPETQDSRSGASVRAG